MLLQLIQFIKYVIKHSQPLLKQKNQLHLKMKNNMKLNVKRSIHFLIILLILLLNWYKIINVKLSNKWCQHTMHSSALDQLNNRLLQLLHSLIQYCQFAVKLFSNKLKLKSLNVIQLLLKLLIWKWNRIFYSDMEILLREFQVLILIQLLN